MIPEGTGEPRVVRGVRYECGTTTRQQSRLCLRMEQRIDAATEAEYQRVVAILRKHVVRWAKIDSQRSQAVLSALDATHDYSRPEHGLPAQGKESADPLPMDGDTESNLTCPEERRPDHGLRDCHRCGGNPSAKGRHGRCICAPPEERFRDPALDGEVYPVAGFDVQNDAPRTEDGRQA